MSWTHDGGMVSIGTEGSDALWWRATRGGLPSEWACELPNDAGRNADRDPAERLEPLGVSLALPPLPAGARAQVHLAAAADPTRDPDDVQTWLAIDLEGGRLETAAGWLTPWR